MLRTIFLRNLREHLDRTGISYLEVQRRCGVSADLVSRHVRGDLRDITLGTVEKICNGLGLDASAMIDD